MKIQDIKNMDREDVLGLLGLETKRSAPYRWLAALGTVAVGLLVGAGVALLLAPKAGSELREDLRMRIRRGGKEFRGNGSEATGTGEASI